MRKTASIVFLSFLLITAAGIFFAIYELRSFSSHRQNSFSYSLVGHRGLVQFLKQTGFDVQINQHVSVDPGRKKSNVGLAVLCPLVQEQGTDRAQKRHLGEQYGWDRLSNRFQHQLIALQKWTTRKSKQVDGWIRKKELVSKSSLSSFLDENGPQKIIRPYTANTETHTVSFRESRSFAIRVESLQVFPKSTRGEVVASVGDYPILVRDPAHPDRLWLSDPDVFSNQGLSSGDNAAFVHSVFSTAFPSKRLLIDEVHHGFIVQHTLGELLFTFPGIVLTGNLLLFFVFLYWSLFNSWGGRKQISRQERSRVQQAQSAGDLTYQHGKHQEAVQLYLKHVLDYIQESFNISRDVGKEDLPKKFQGRDDAMANQLETVVSDLQKLNSGSRSRSELVRASKRANQLLQELQHETGQTTPGPLA